MLAHNTHPRIARQRGMSLVEMSITLAIVGILLVLGMPSFVEWLQNSQIRTASSSIMSGLQIARSEAVRRNARVVFTLTNPGVTGGTGWTVTLADGTAIQSAPAGEGSRSAVVTATPAGANAVTFTGYGRTPEPPNNLNGDGSALLTQIDIDSAILAAATSRDMRIMITTGGQIRMCDPNFTIVGDPRVC